VLILRKHWIVHSDQQQEQWQQQTSQQVILLLNTAKASTAAAAREHQCSPGISPSCCKHMPWRAPQVPPWQLSGYLSVCV